MKNYSIWQADIQKKSYPKLTNDITCDVLIIGGGISGISTLYHLKNSKLKVVLTEQQEIGCATTARSTGKLSFLQNDLLDKIRTTFGDEVAKKYLNSQIEAIKLTKDIIVKENISCDLMEVNSKLYTNKENEISDLKNLAKFIKLCKIKVTESSCSLVNSKYMIEVGGTYVYHPLKFVLSLANNLENIYEHTSVRKIKKMDDMYVCYTPNAKIKTKYIIIASHYPFFNFPFLFPIKATLEKSFLEASSYKGDDISLISYSYPFISIRNYHDYLIYLSNSHMINRDTNDQKNFYELSKKIQDLSLKPEYLWSNIDIMTNDGLPYVGIIGHNMLMATGYNTWGLTNGILAGKIISDIILKRKNAYIDLFDPKRSNLEQIIGGIKATLGSISGYAMGLMKSKTGISCPHMGCKLIYNEIEKTYDCPCHGSRFDKDGKVIVSPANKDIKLS